MGKILIGGASGGLTSTDVTASRNDVVAPFTALTKDSNDEPVTGTLIDIKADVASVNSWQESNNSYCLDFPPGAYRRSDIGERAGGRIFVAADKLYSDLGIAASKIATGQYIAGAAGTYTGLGTAGQADVRSGRTFSNSYQSNVWGVMPEQGYSHNVPGTYNRTIVAANRYVSGNIDIAGDPNLVPGNIRKGAVIFGVTGTAEGYYPSPTDLYYKGHNIKGFTKKSGAADFQATRIYCSGDLRYASAGFLNFASATDVTIYSRLVIEGSINFYDSCEGILLYDYSPSSVSTIARFTVSPGIKNRVEFDIRNVTILPASTRFGFSMLAGSYIERIGLE